MRLSGGFNQYFFPEHPTDSKGYSNSDANCQLAIDRNSCATGSEVERVGDTCACHHAQHTYGGIRISFGRHDQLTEGATAQQSGGYADEVEAE